MKTGTTTVGVICKDGVVLAAESKATMGYLVSSKDAKKIYSIDDRIALTISGGVGDTQHLIRMLKAEINIYKIGRNSEITVNAVNTLLSNILQSSRYYPLMAMLILGGVDKNGKHLFSIDPVGGSGEDECTATGSGSPIAFGVLENGYRRDLKKEEAISLAVRAIRSAKERDIFSGGNQINAIFIDENGIEEIEENKIKEILKVKAE